jgi:protocatechuate 3,4-dioxygenase beta subunit
MIRKTNLQSIFSILLTASFVLIFVVFDLAQTGTSAISGSVTDAQGSAVAGANVTLNNPDNGFSRTTTTTESGLYNFASVPPGKYKITIEKQGFKKSVKADIQAQVDTPTTVNISLEVGNVGTEIVTVSTAEDAPINTTNGSIGNTITTKQIIQLPLNARNTPDLLSLQPALLVITAMKTAVQ